MAGSGSVRKQSSNADCCGTSKANAVLILLLLLIVQLTINLNFVGDQAAAVSNHVPQSAMAAANATGWPHAAARAAARVGRWAAYPEPEARGPDRPLQLLLVTSTNDCAQVARAAGPNGTLASWKRIRQHVVTLVLTPATGCPSLATGDAVEVLPGLHTMATVVALYGACCCRLLGSVRTTRPARDPPRTDLPAVACLLLARCTNLRANSTRFGEGRRGGGRVSLPTL